MRISLRLKRRSKVEQETTGAYLMTWCHIKTRCLKRRNEGEGELPAAVSLWARFLADEISARKFERL